MTADQELMVLLEELERGGILFDECGSFFESSGEWRYKGSGVVVFLRCQNPECNIETTLELNYEESVRALFPVSPVSVS